MDNFPCLQWCKWCTKSQTTSEEDAKIPPSLNLLQEVGVIDTISDLERLELQTQAGEERVGIASFSDYDGGNVDDAGGDIDSTRDLACSHDDDIAQFFARPVKILSTPWLYNGAVFAIINPWTAFFGNPRVVNRISNFNLLKARLHLKIIINGTPFHFGRAMVSYMPNDNKQQFAFSRGAVAQDAISESQRPHVYLNPTTCKGGEMVLPMYYYFDAIDIVRSGWVDMGLLTLRSLDTLKLVTPGNNTNSVTISIFAWATDVTLDVPTNRPSNSIVPQSGDEYGTGLISKPASAVARFAATLTNVPYIGQYAAASQMIASTMASVAKMFGYSRPTIVADPCVMKPMFVGNWANTDAADTSLKLTADSKQELSIDPRIPGRTAVDEMSIAHIASIESYFTSFSWSTNTAPETLLFSLNVCPGIYDTSPVGSEYHLTPSCVLNNAFGFWRGEMEYRFMVCCSAMHRGRLKIVYDPQIAGSAAEYNTAFTQIVDISEQSDFKIRIGWGQDRAYLRCTDTSTNPKIWDGSAVGVIPLTGSSNGALQVFVVNELTAPSATTLNVSILVFSSMHNADFCAPRGEEIAKFSPFPPVAQALAPVAPLVASLKQDPVSVLELHAGAAEDSILEGMDSTPQMEPTMTMAAYGDTSHLSSVYFGEVIGSIRTLIKRYSHIRTYCTPLRDSTYEITSWDWFGFRGYSIAGLDRTAANTPYNFHNVTFLHWFLPCFAGARGGTRVKYVRSGFRSRSGADPSVLTAIYRNNKNTKWGADQLSPNPTTQLEARYGFPAIFQKFYSDMASGAASTAPNNNPVIEAELPMYRNYRYFPTRLAGDNIGTNEFMQTHTFVDTAFAVENQFSYVNILLAGADDFSLSFWIGAPPLYVYSDPSPKIT